MKQSDLIVVKLQGERGGPPRSVRAPDGYMKVAEEWNGIKRAPSCTIVFARSEVLDHVHVVTSENDLDPDGVFYEVPIGNKSDMRVFVDKRLTVTYQNAETFDTVEGNVVVNLSPYNVLISPEGDDGDNVVMLPSGNQVAEVRLVRTGEVAQTVEFSFLRIDVWRYDRKEVHGLPDPQPGVLFFVSPSVFVEASDRDDLITSDQKGRLAFKEDGSVVLVCSSFIGR